MAIRVVCDCGRELNLKDELAGKKGKCPGCGAVILVPTLEEVAAQAAAAESEAWAARAAAEAPPADEPESAEQTKPCVHCRKPIPADAVFCTHCGTHLRTGKKHEGGENREEEGKFDFLKASLDLLTRPMDAVGAIIEAPLSADSLKKALILFAVGMTFFTWMIPLNNEAAIKFGIDSQGLSVWAFVLAFLLGLVVVITDALICSLAGSMFGTTSVGFASVFMSVVAVRAIIGLAMAVLLFVLFTTPVVLVMAWVPRVIRFGWGTLLLYCVILQSYDCGPVPAVVFAAGATVVQGIIFWLPSLIAGIRLV